MTCHCLCHCRCHCLLGLSLNCSLSLPPPLPLPLSSTSTAAFVLGPATELPTASPKVLIPEDSAEDGPGTADLLARHAATSIFTTPSVVRRLLEPGGEGPAVLRAGRLRRVIMTGEPVPPVRHRLLPLPLPLYRRYRHRLCPVLRLHCLRCQDTAFCPFHCPWWLNIVPFAPRVLPSGCTTNSELSGRRRSSGSSWSSQTATAGPKSAIQPLGY